MKEQKANDNFYERLESLRELTKLSPIAYAKLVKARNSKDSANNIKLSADEIDILEYALRERALEKIVEKDWENYLEIEHDGYGLNDFANAVLNEHINNKNNNNVKSR